MKRKLNIKRNKDTHKHKDAYKHTYKEDIAKQKQMMIRRKIKTNEDRDKE